MPYNRVNLLHRILNLQREVVCLQEQHRGVPLTIIYRDYIKDKYNISMSTFSNWLGIPAAMELEKIERKKSKKIE